MFYNSSNTEQITVFRNQQGLFSFRTQEITRNSFHAHFWKALVKDFGGRSSPWLQLGKFVEESVLQYAEDLKKQKRFFSCLCIYERLPFLSLIDTATVVPSPSQQKYLQRPGFWSDFAYLPFSWDSWLQHSQLQLWKRTPMFITKRRTMARCTQVQRICYILFPLIAILYWHSFCWNGVCSSV